MIVFDVLYTYVCMIVRENYRCIKLHHILVSQSLLPAPSL